MAIVQGGPGTFFGLFLRIMQLISAAFSFAYMFIALRLFNYKTFLFLEISMLLAMTWCIIHIFYDVICLWIRVTHHSRAFLTGLLIGDWVTMYMTLAAASSSLAAAIFLSNNTNECRFNPAECSMYTTSALLALLSWFFSFISALIMLWIRASM